MADKNKRTLVGITKIHKRRHKGCTVLLIQSRRWLIRDNKAWRVKQCPRNSDPLLLTNTQALPR